MGEDNKGEKKKKKKKKDCEPHTAGIFRMPLAPDCNTTCKVSCATPVLGQFISCTSAQTPRPNPLRGSRSAEAIARLRRLFGGLCLMMPRFHSRQSPRLLAWTQSLRLIGTDRFCSLFSPSWWFQNTYDIYCVVYYSVTGAKHRPWSSSW